MCTAIDERTILVCNAATGRVKEDVGATLDAGVQYTAVPGHGTLVTANPTIDAERFSRTAQAAIAAAQRPAGDAS